MIFLFFDTPTVVEQQHAPWTKRILHLSLVRVVLIMNAVTSYILSLQYAGQIAYRDDDLDVISLLVGSGFFSIAFSLAVHSR